MVVAPGMDLSADRGRFVFAGALTVRVGDQVGGAGKQAFLRAGEQAVPGGKTPITRHGHLDA